MHNGACASQLLVHSFAGKQILVGKYTFGGKKKFTGPQAIQSHKWVPYLEGGREWYDIHVMIYAIFAYVYIIYNI